MGLGTGRKTRGLYLEKELEIGNWDMDTDPTKAVAHGLSDYKKIRNITAMIRNDADTEQHMIWSVDGGYTSAAGSISTPDADNITLSREALNYFDSANYSTVGGYNRGWIYIEYAR